MVLPAPHFALCVITARLRLALKPHAVTCAAVPILDARLGACRVEDEAEEAEKRQRQVLLSDPGRHVSRFFFISFYKKRFFQMARSSTPIYSY